MDHQSTPEPDQNSSSQEVESIGQAVAHPVPFSSSAEILRYIDQILMEDDDVEPHIILLQEESPEFRAKERSFYAVIGQEYPPSPHQQSSLHQNVHENNNNVAIKEFDDDVWMYSVDDATLAAQIANMQLGGGLKIKQQQGPNPIRSWKRSKNKKSDKVVDLRTLLTDCAKYVLAGNYLAACTLLFQIRRYSSPSGDGNQRLAHYFADGLEARLAGIGCQPHEMTSSPDYMRAYRIFRASASSRKISSFACNETIVVRSKRATRIHVVDFGILYGIQWPSFIRRLAGREDGPPEMLRITGVEFPLMAGIIEDTGRRLASYAEKLGVPFEYKAIAREWETIKTEDLGIEKGEFVAVVCSVRSLKLMDEAVGVGESPRDRFLKVVREMNPDIFIHGILNGSYNQPFFMYRFRDLMFHFMSVFDMLDSLSPRDKPERMMAEGAIGKEILNVIACEGPERVERPETYLQWEVRHLKAGLIKVPFEKNLTDAIICKVNNFYHKDFAIFEERRWLMMSWKGRIFYAASCWQPVRKIQENV